MRWVNGYEEFQKRQQRRADAARTNAEREAILAEPVHDVARDTRILLGEHDGREVPLATVARSALSLASPFILYIGLHPARRVTRPDGTAATGPEAARFLGARRGDPAWSGWRSAPATSASRDELVEIAEAHFRG